MNGVVDEGKDILLATKLDLFTIGMVSLPTSIPKNSFPNSSIIELEDQFWHTNGSIRTDITLS